MAEHLGDVGDALGYAQEGGKVLVAGSAVESYSGAAAPLSTRIRYTARLFAAQT